MSAGDIYERDCDTAMMDFSSFALDRMNEAIKAFGEYTYIDKGPHEVMDVQELTDMLTAMTPISAADAILALADRGSNAKDLAQTLVGSLDHWDALFDRPGIENLY